MRINLVTPFAEKDTVKALGARWDGTKKVWYIVDAPDLTPFMRWIPDLDAASAAAPMPQADTKSAARQSHGIITKPSVDVQHCGCAALPWEDCPHSASEKES